MVTDVYEQYFKADCVFSGVPRRAALVKLTSDSEAGNIRYTVSVSFFPHTDEEDFAVSCDAFAEREVFAAKGRRSKKREQGLLDSLREEADGLAAQLDGEIFWDEPLGEARMG